MKCIKNIKYDNVMRVTDGDAEKLVSSGNFKYVPKKEWKDQNSSILAVGQ